MGSSYTRYNSKIVTPFIDRRFLRDPTIQKISLSISSLNIYCSPLQLIYLINNISLFSLISLTSFTLPQLSHLFSLSLPSLYNSSSPLLIISKRVKIISKMQVELNIGLRIKVCKFLFCFFHECYFLP